MASPHHRHQSSLEGVIDFSDQSLEPDERNRATQIFKQIIAYYEPAQREEPYRQITLIRLTQEYTLSQNNFLKYFFLYVGRELHLDEPNFSQILSNFVQFDSWDTERKNGLGTRVIAFADYLINNFFLPLKASSRKTSQPSPAALSEASTQQQQLTGTTQRISTLRRDCLIRDRYRCVISRKFDLQEAENRTKKDGDNFKDDDGNLLRDEVDLEVLEVAHILPHFLMSFSPGGEQTELSDSKQTALTILDMFDPGVTHLINGSLIDRPINALTLTHTFHYRFGNFEVYFEPTTDIDTQTRHRYKIDSVRSLQIFRGPIFPVIRTLYLTPDHTIDPPSPRLLAIHRVCAFILHLSGAGDYINKILRDMDEVDIKEDGSTELGRLVGLKVDGWLDGISAC